MTTKWHDPATIRPQYTTQSAVFCRKVVGMTRAKQRARRRVDLRQLVSQSPATMRSVICRKLSRSGNNRGSSRNSPPPPAAVTTTIVTDSSDRRSPRERACQRQLIRPPVRVKVTEVDSRKSRPRWCPSTVPRSADYLYSVYLVFRLFTWRLDRFVGQFKLENVQNTQTY